jgi:hypothetical protein
MTQEHHIETCRQLDLQIAEAGLHYYPPPKQYDPGHVFDLKITGVCPSESAQAQFEIERFVGSGFAGQVYRARLLQLDGGPISGLTTGTAYAVKINVPRSGFARRFRNLIYWLGFQSGFPYQVNAAAARVGVLWQKLVRRAAGIRFHSERCVADTYATFFDPVLGSHGEVNEWVDGRTWRFEIDDEVFKRGKVSAEFAEKSREYLAKKEFMAELVHLLHEMGAHELARQYEWWTAKSQPNVLKRVDHDDGPASGLTALDFRAGLALLPFFPMSPMDFVLIVRGLRRGAVVQFDRGDLEKLETFCDDYPAEFHDLRPAIEELARLERNYRASQVDVFHHGIRLANDPELRSRVQTGLAQGWKVQGLVDDPHAWRLTESRAAFWVFYVLGCLPLLGKRLRRYWGNPAYARHVRACFTDGAYCLRALRAWHIRALADWRRDGRIDEAGMQRYLNAPALFAPIRFVFAVLPMPASWQRFLTAEWRTAWNVVVQAVKYPIRFYRDATFRVDWLTAEIEEGAREGMLTPHEKEHILSRVTDPFIQKYLKCVAVHVCTLPVTQVVSVIIAIWAIFFLGESWRESLLWAIGILAFFQSTPISPGSLVRGTYVVYLMIKERNWRNYWLAVLVSYWHYIGYLGFPLQMVKEFPSLSRYMAGRWATKMVRIVPVFGERGALLEHGVFDAFFNVPLSIKRRLTPVADGHG